VGTKKEGKPRSTARKEKEKNGGVKVKGGE